MKTQYTVALALLTGVWLGAFAVQGLHAQQTAPTETKGVTTITPSTHGLSANHQSG